MTPASEKRQRNVQDRVALIAAFPNLFSVRGVDKKPLAKGVNTRIRAIGVWDADGVMLSNERVREAIGDYCHGPKYLVALYKGGPRYDLDGSINGAVTEQESDDAIWLLRRKYPVWANKHGYTKPLEKAA